MMVWNSPTLLC